jgi:glycosyltransferase involved in cell wall biosynthesis
VFMQRHDDVRVYLHTERHGAHTGHNLDVLIKAVGLPEGRWKFVNQWAQHMNIPNEAMATIFTASDVLLASTYGEGFGLTTLEAAACGTVVIGNNFTCQPEMIGEGWLTENQPWWNGPQLAWWAIPRVESILESLEEAYARGKGRSAKQIEHAAQYDADHVFETYWKPALKALAS